MRAGAADIAPALLYRYGLARRKPFTASAEDLTLGEVSIDTARRQLRKLEAAGLVRVEHHPGCKPTITVIDSPSNDQENHT